MPNLKRPSIAAVLLAGIGLAFQPTPAAAADVIYNAFSSFNGTQLNGGFAYLSVPLTGGGFTPLVTGGAGCVIGGSVCLQTPVAGFPGAYRSASQFVQFTTIAVPNDRLLLHPGATTNIVVTFVAPVSALYSYVADFNLLDRMPSGVGLFRVDGSSGTNVVTALGGLGSTIRSQRQSGSAFLQAGRSFSFGVNPVGTPAGDSVGFNYVLTRTVAAGVPEPGVWTVMIIGFGVVGFALRRRKAPRLRSAL